MSVAVEISQVIMRDEVALARDVARQYKWGIVPKYADLKLLVTMYSHTGDLYILEITCDDYKEKPPFFEFIDPETGEPGTRYAYPKTHDSLFHDSGPCICAPFSRKAYKSVVATGPHSDWQFANWMNCKDSNVDWSNYSKLGDMLGLIQTRLGRQEYYKGRMA